MKKMLFLLALALFSCQNRLIKGEILPINIFNGCGDIDAAIQFKEVIPLEKLKIVSLDNANNFNYYKTVIISRTDNKIEINIIKNVLKIDNIKIIKRENSKALFDIYLGNDYKKIIERIKND